MLREQQHPPKRQPRRPTTLTVKIAVIQVVKPLKIDLNEVFMLGDRPQQGYFP